MNKQELIDAILAKDTELESKAAAGRALEAVLEAVAEGVKQDGSVQLIGFGTFQVKTRPAREGRNPSTGEKIKIAESTTVAFKAGAALKGAVAVKKAPAKKAAAKAAKPAAKAAAKAPAKAAAKAPAKKAAKKK
ncbi:MAG: HU family DNA-binding protein [Fibrobacter sp.]|nr:HU family DNA-binding protein [Fibrobacter sp.]